MEDLLSEALERPPSGARHVCDASEEQWLEQRRRYITASDVAVLMGSNPYQTPEALAENRIRDVRALMRGEESTLSIPTTTSMWWGQWLEGPVADAVSVLLGLRVRTAQRMYALDDVLSCTIDAVCVRDEGFVPEPGLFRGPNVAAGRRGVPEADRYDRSWVYDLLQVMESVGQPSLLEIKTTAEFVGRKHSYRDCPALYEAQVQAQMLVTGHSSALVACLVGGNDLKAWFVEADASYQSEIRRRVREFQLLVQASVKGSDDE